jgi:CheY-like chemotaxis protein
VITKPVKILVADDDADDQSLIREAFFVPSFPIEVITAFDGAQLLTILDDCKKSEDKPDIIILDLNMPIMDGLTALTRIKKKADCNDIPVYILSTSKHLSDQKACELMGAKQFFTKPAAFNQLQSVAHQILSQEFPQIFPAA